jgi:hypothetical protein
MLSSTIKTVIMRFFTSLVSILGMMSFPFLDWSVVAFSFQVTLDDGSTCTFLGEQYTAGAALIGFETRCGSSEDFPCFCDPSQNPPVSCPYCSFALPNEGLLCLYEGDTETFTDVDDGSQTCTCVLDANDQPVPTCDDRSGLTASQTSTSIQEQQSDTDNDTCTLDLPDGGSRTFTRGESIGDVLPNRCGDDFPCFCNPDAPDSVECPYCRYPTQDGDLLCAGDGESISFTDLEGQEQSCSCVVPSDPTMNPISNCDSGEAAGESFNEENDDNSDGSNSNGNNNIDGMCTLELESGQVVTFSSGESYGDYMQTRCGSSAEFPCFCNPELKNQMECPYCGFVQAGGGLLCAKDQEVVSFNDGEKDQTCTCEIPSDPSQEAIQTCVEGDDLPPTSTPSGNVDNDDNDDSVDEDNEDDDNNETAGCTITDLDGNIVTIPHGDSFGDLVEDVCGDPDEWPAYCNTEPETSVVSRAKSQDSDTIEYPYCVYTDTMSGETICARDNEQVAYVDTLGDKIECMCSYSPSGLGGAQSTCELTNDSSPINQSTNPPTMTPLPNSAATMSSTELWKSIASIAGVFFPLWWPLW